jgi:hypothetical protein
VMATMRLRIRFSGEGAGKAAASRRLPRGPTV